MKVDTTFPCPNCPTGRLATTSTKNVAGGVNRYRKCKACGHKAVSEERAVKTKRGRPAAR